MCERILTVMVIMFCLIGCQKSADTYFKPVQNPPGGLKPEEVPQFVCLGFDDNSYSGYPGSGSDGGMAWAVQLFANRTNPDGTPCRATFYCPSRFIDPALENSGNDSLLKEAWRSAYQAGHEIGLHTHTHPHGCDVAWDKDPPVWRTIMSVADWLPEIEKNITFLTKPYEPSASEPDAWGPGVAKNDIVGFRTPYLEFNNATFEALCKQGTILYDCSIEEGYEEDQDGTNLFWPYQLDKGSPVADATFASSFSGREIIGSYPGLWEMPAYCMFAPDDGQCENYGLKPGFRDELKKRFDYFNPADGKITGFDWNLWVEYSMTGEEVEAVLKYTLDQRLRGNRAPFTVGLHSDIYCNRYKENNDGDNQIAAHYKESQKAIENFIDYALSKKEVRIVAAKAVVAWMQEPKPL